MKTYDDLDIIGLVLDGDSDAIARLETEIQERDKAIVELYSWLYDAYDILMLHSGLLEDDEILTKASSLIKKHSGFAVETANIYGIKL